MEGSNLPRDQFCSIQKTDILTVGSLFSGIGGFELGFEATGRFETRVPQVAQVVAERLLQIHDARASDVSDS